MLPLKDYNPTRRTALVTLALLLLNVGVYFFVQPIGRATVTANDQSEASEARHTTRRAAIPKELVDGQPLTEEDVAEAYGDVSIVGVVCDVPVVNQRFRFNADQPCWPEKNVYLAALVSMFLHGSILHLAGNMLFLWVFGNNIEDRLGPLKYLFFYVIGGLVATATYVVLNADSTVPLVGASGAVAGVMGAYLVLFPKVRIRALIFFLVIDVPAALLLVGWLASQFLLNQEGVAWAAHVGGFVFGMLAGLLIRSLGTPEPSRPDPVPRY